MNKGKFELKNLLNRDMAFVAGLAIYMAVLMLSGRDLKPASKAMPAALCLLCFVLIAVKALRFCFGEAVEGSGKKVFSPRSFLFMGWLILMGLSFYMVGYLATVVVGLAGILRVFSKASWAQTAGITLGTTLFIYVLFVRVLSVRFPTGTLF